MSQVIYAIVDAPDAKYALKNGRKTFDHLIGATLDGCNRFNHYRTFDQDSHLPTKSDGTEYPTSVRLNSTEGQELLADGWNKTKNEFRENLKNMREEIAKLSDEEIMKDISGVRNEFMHLGETAGPSIYLYNQYGDGIRTPEEFKRACCDMRQPWIVPGNIKL